ncbi:MAG: TonB family protein, partial [Spiribacter sp.]|nr:TonB family protein [Spiribacter sp.]
EPEPEQEEQAVAEPKSDAAPAPEPEPSAESAPQPASKAIEGADKTIDSDWLAQLKAHLSAHVYYPQQAKWRGQEGKVVVSMHISGEGRVKDYKIIRSSGVAALDAAVTEMLERAGPFPEPPADQSTRRSQQVSVPIIFSLQN